MKFTKTEADIRCLQSQHIVLETMRRDIVERQAKIIDEIRRLEEKAA